MRVSYTGADPGGGERTRRAPHKIGKNMIFWRKIVIFHTRVRSPPPGSAPV
jgi:hypothetical protein